MVGSKGKDRVVEWGKIEKIEKDIDRSGTFCWELGGALDSDSGYRYLVAGSVV